MLAKELEGIILSTNSPGSNGVVLGWTIAILWVFIGGAAGVHLFMIKRCIKNTSDATSAINIAIGNP